MGQPPVTLHSDVLTDHNRPFVPEFFSANVQKYLGIKEARLEDSNHQALFSSTYTSILWDPYLHPRVLITASPGWIGSPNDQKHFHW
ncbi:hypothetical protein NPIL_211 [Nephila pilipes]|uniref:Uncharacterized protein n=1 Tax=Nephila pilipes TaxID=299642 RepID=A0A8X6QYB6_NEPPI|nr:hypothetical protein NPIL_211 [Nephila pilipes]